MPKRVLLDGSWGLRYLGRVEDLGSCCSLPRVGKRCCGIQSRPAFFGVGRFFLAGVSVVAASFCCGLNPLLRALDRRVDQGVLGLNTRIVWGVGGSRQGANARINKKLESIWTYQMVHMSIWQKQCGHMNRLNWTVCFGHIAIWTYGPLKLWTTKRATRSRVVEILS